MKKIISPSVFTKNQCLVFTVSASKKNVAPTRPCARKSLASVAIHCKSPRYVSQSVCLSITHEASICVTLKIEKPAPVFSTKSAIACWRKRPTITVGHGIALRFVEERKKQHWKMSNPSTEIARSSYFVFYYIDAHNSYCVRNSHICVSARSAQRRSCALFIGGMARKDQKHRKSAECMHENQK